MREVVKRRCTTFPLLLTLSSALLRATNTLALSPLYQRRYNKVTSTNSVYLLPRRLYTVSNTFLKVTGESTELEEDVNALPDSKRRLSEVMGMVISNLDVLNVKILHQKVRDMEEESSQAEFWENQEKAQALLLEMNRLKILIERADNWKTSCEDIEALLGKKFIFPIHSFFCRFIVKTTVYAILYEDMAQEDEEDRGSYVDEAVKTLNALEKDLDAFEVERLLNGKYDKAGCTVVIQSGAGGTEAQDWAGMYAKLAFTLNNAITTTLSTFQTHRYVVQNVQAICRKTWIQN